MTFFLFKIYRILACLLAGLLYGLIQSWIIRTNGEDPTSFFEKGYFAASWIIFALPSFIYIWKYGLRASYDPESWTVTHTYYSDGGETIDDERSRNKLIYAIIDLGVAFVFAPLIILGLLISCTRGYLLAKREEEASPSFFLTPWFAYLFVLAAWGIPYLVYVLTGLH